MTNTKPSDTIVAKQCNKSLQQQIDVVAEFWAHRIPAARIAYRTGIALSLVNQLTAGEAHQRVFKQRLDWHRRQRRATAAKKSLRFQGVARTDYLQRIDRDCQDSDT